MNTELDHPESPRSDGPGLSAQAGLLAAASALCGGAPATLATRDRDGRLHVIARDGAASPGHVLLPRVAAHLGPDGDNGHSPVTCAMARMPDGSAMVVACETPPQQAIAPGTLDALGGIARAAAALAIASPPLDDPSSQAVSLLQTMIDAVPDHIWAKDHDGRYLAINRAAAEAFGFGDPANGLGRSVHDVFAPERAAIAEAEDRVVMESGQPAHGILHPGAVTGEQRWWLANKIPMTDASGRVTGLIGISREVTEIEQARADLARERDCLQQILDAIPDAIFVKDREGRIVLHNQSTAQRLADSLGDRIIGAHVRDYYRGDRLERALEQDRFVLETGCALINEIERSDASCRERWDLVSKAPLYDASGAITGLVGIARDVTAIHQTERALSAERDQLQTILDSLPISVYLKDVRRRYVRINRMAADRIGIATPSDVIGQTAAAFWDPESAARILREEDRLLSGETDAIEGIDYQPRPDGSESIVLYTKQMLHNGEGRVVGMIGTDRDITRVIALERQLAAAKEAEEEASREAATLNATKGGMLAMLSHDFRTPLTAIQGYSDMIRDYNLDRETVRDYASEVSLAASRLAQLTSDMLELDRLQSGNEHLSLVPVALQPVVLEVVDLLAGQAAAHEIRLDLPDGLPPALGDAGALRRIFTNLLGNAIKYSPDGGKIDLSARDARDGFITVSVRDRGLGIPEADLERVFLPYVRLDSGRQRGITGTGLGLPIVRELARAQGGEVWAERADDDGSVFRLRLPIAPAGA